jgi:hypothetical protein
MLTVLESLLKSPIDLIKSFFLTSLFEIKKSLGHLLSNLFRGFEICHEFLLIHLVLSFQQDLQSMKSRHQL